MDGHCHVDTLLRVPLHVQTQFLVPRASSSVRTAHLMRAVRTVPFMIRALCPHERKAQRAVWRAVVRVLAQLQAEA